MTMTLRKVGFITGQYGRRKHNSYAGFEKKMILLPEICLNLLRVEGADNISKYKNILSSSS
jgi:hypothetical protein